MLQLLSIGPSNNLLAATLVSAAQTAALFTGPLLFKAVVASEQRQQRKQIMHQSSWAPSLYTLRDIVIAPLTEEWCFRACMVPLLWLEVCNKQLVWCRCHQCLLVFPTIADKCWSCNHGMANLWVDADNHWSTNLVTNQNGAGVHRQLP